MSVLTLKSAEYNEFPDILKDYCNYTIIIKGNSEKTVCEYLQDLRTFFRFLIIKKKDTSISYDDFETVSIKNINEEDIRLVNERFVLEFLMFTQTERKNSSTTRSRKISALRSFFKYICTKTEITDVDPTANIDTPKKGKKVPKYLTLEDSIALLQAVKNDTESTTVTRDYAIISLFLNTGMRLSELVGLNLESFDSQITSVKVLGKGNKERIIYINAAAREAIEDYLRIRLDPQHIKTSDHALFLSGRQQRISNKTVQYIVYKYLNLAGLAVKGMSVHKLRHTAATLMYQSGKVDIRVLKDILGHEQLNTTEIYTHIVERNLMDAVDNNPLAGVKITRDVPTEED